MDWPKAPGLNHRGLAPGRSAAGWRSAMMRFIVNKLEFEAVVREDDAGRWLDVSWGMTESTDSARIVKKILSLLLDQLGKPV